MLGREAARELRARDAAARDKNNFMGKRIREKRKAETLKINHGCTPMDTDKKRNNKGTKQQKRRHEFHELMRIGNREIRELHRRRNWRGRGRGRGRGFEAEAEADED